MALVDLEFEKPLNVSCQIGDSTYHVDANIVYTSNTTYNSGVSGGLPVKQNTTDPEYIGIIQDIQHARNLPPYNLANPAPKITVDTLLPSSTFHYYSAFIFFSKDNKVNLSSILGYYADIEFKNNATDYAEMFSVGIDTFVSSK